MASQVQTNTLEKFSLPIEKIEKGIHGWDVRSLAVEVVLKIFQLLELKDLSNVLLVSKQWRNIGEDPSLWKKFVLRIKPTDPSCLRSILRRPRFALMDSAIIKDNFWNKILPSQVEDLVKEITKKKLIKHVHIQLERDVLNAAPNMDTIDTKDLLGELPGSVKVQEKDMKILEIRPCRAGRSITYKYRVQFHFLLNLL